jgi:hypothetical protein
MPAPKPSAVERDAAYRASRADGHEYSKVLNFVAACRQQWPGACIVLRPEEESPLATLPDGQPKREDMP